MRPHNQTLWQALFWAVTEEGSYVYCKPQRTCQKEAQSRPFSSLLSYGSTQSNHKRIIPDDLIVGPFRGVRDHLECSHTHKNKLISCENPDTPHFSSGNQKCLWHIPVSACGHSKRLSRSQTLGVSAIIYAILLILILFFFINFNLGLLKQQQSHFFLLKQTFSVPKVKKKYAGIFT